MHYMKPLKQQLAKMYKPLRVYKCIRVKGECARPRAHMTAKKEKNTFVTRHLLLLRFCHLSQPGIQVSCHCASPDRGGNRTTDG